MQRFVVGLTRVVDDALQADVATDLVTGLVEQQKGDQTRSPSVAILERVNHQEVKDVGPEQQERVVRLGALQLIKATMQLGHRHRPGLER